MKRLVCLFAGHRWYFEASVTTPYRIGGLFTMRCARCGRISVTR